MPITRIAVAIVLSIGALRGAAAGTGTFIDRTDPDDLRVVSFNVLSDSLFPENGQLLSSRFARIAVALDADILCLQEVYADDAAASRTVDLLNAIAPLPAGARWYGYKGRDSVTLSRFPLLLSAPRVIPAGERDLCGVLVDLPDNRFRCDLYLLNNHFACCGNEPARQRQADAIVNWLRDARTPGGAITLPRGTGLVVLGDLNIVGSGAPLATLLTGDIANEATFGPDAPPDWSGGPLADPVPRHNGSGRNAWTWRDDTSAFDPGRLDYVLYSNSVLEVAHSFVLNTTTMSDDDLSATGLQALDVVVDLVGAAFDHLPVVVDFRPRQTGCASDIDGDGVVGLADLAALLAVFGDAPPPVVRLSEIRTRNVDSQTDALVEIQGPAGASLSGVSLITLAAGRVSNVVPLAGRAIGPEGRFVIGHPELPASARDVAWAMNYGLDESVTHTLVADFGGSANQQLDLTGDGVLDATPWTFVLDAVAQRGVGAGAGHVYANAVEPFVGAQVAHIFRCDITTDWLPGGYHPNSGADTPRAANLACPGARNADLTRDGAINLADLAQMLADFGQSCP